ncbi:hypothetical protein B0I35DRAFT_447384 [Stachybotrys elegans]|uniref:Uncharacterized protein n=1 Tax=Stachybotrys elegans TaxID=80388 RepID=A0A8K0S7T3_9HYPO|nr:hypothetical protein B0I35DRAFT_447384 [Stachybotrys elegans]
MLTVDSDVVGETSGADGDSLGRNAEVKRRRLIQPSIRKPSAKITKKKQSKKVPPRGSVRHFPCRQCVARASKAPGHECASQDNTGAACWDCAKNGHTCRPVPVEARAAVPCGSGAAPPPAPRQAHALASFGEVADGSLEERKLIALETIAGAARLWIQLNQLDEEDGDEEEEDD